MNVWRTLSNAREFLSDAWQRVSEAQLPHIWSGRQRSMPTYTLGYNAFKRIPTPISWPATWGLWLAWVWLAEAPVVFLDNAIDTTVNWIPNVYNRGVDLYNAGASERAMNNYFEGPGKRWREQVLRRERQDALDTAVEKTKDYLASNELARRKISWALNTMKKTWEIISNPSKAKLLINLYNRLKQAWAY